MALLKNLLAPFAHASIAARMTRLEERAAEMELAWAETLDKLSAWAKRQSKRERDAAGRALAEETGAPGSATTDDRRARKHLLWARLRAKQGSGGISS